MTSPVNLEHLEPEQLWPSRLWYRTCQLTAGLNLAQYFFCGVPLCANRREKATMHELNWFRNATFLSRLGSAPGLTQKAAAPQANFQADEGCADTSDSTPDIFFNEIEGEIAEQFSPSGDLGGGLSCDGRNRQLLWPGAKKWFAVQMPVLTHPFSAYALICTVDFPATASRLGNCSNVRTPRQTLV
jgi:hypothetical protein